MNYRVTCVDGFNMSIAVGKDFYCSPRSEKGPWSAVEIGMPSQEEKLLLPYAEDLSDLTNTVYGWVPSNIVWDVIISHGGITKGKLPVLCVGKNWKKITGYIKNEN